MATVATRRIKAGGKWYPPGADLAELPKRVVKDLVKRRYAIDQVTAAEIARAEEVQQRLESQARTLRERIASAEERIASLTTERDAIDLDGLRKAAQKAKPEDAEATSAALAAAEAEVANYDDQIAQTVASRDEVAEFLAGLEG